jgi:hypothetical protein
VAVEPEVDVADSLVSVGRADAGLGNGQGYRDGDCHAVAPLGRLSWDVPPVVGYS